jgi:hypothetical protein
MLRSGQREVAGEIRAGRTFQAPAVFHAPRQVAPSAEQLANKILDLAISFDLLDLRPRHAHLL